MRTRLMFPATALLALLTGCAGGVVTDYDPVDEDDGVDFGGGDHDGRVAPVRVADIVERTIEGPRALGAFDVDTVAVSEAGATFLKLHFAALDLAPGDELIVRDPAGAVVHTITADTAGGGGLWALAVDGDTAEVTLVAGAAATRGGWVIDRLGVGTAPLDGAPGGGADRSICGGDDKQAAACFGGAIADRSRAVGRLLFPSGGGFSVCTGSLVSDQGHFLTNNHCVASQSAVNDLEVRFGYQYASCGSDNLGQVVATSGGTFLATSSALDYTLVQLPDNPSAQFGFLEIDGSTPSVGEQIYIPQHPGGRPKEIATTDSQTGGPCTVRSINRSIGGYASGANMGYTCDTEGGSSGSPVLSADTHAIVALHHLGGCQNNGTHMRDILPEIAEWVGGSNGEPPPPPPPPPEPDVTELDNGVAVSGLSGAQGSERVFVLDVPADAADLSFAISGGSGDADLYVRFGAPPTVNDWDYRPWLDGNTETVAPDAADEGLWYVMIRGYRAFSGVTLVASYAASGGGGGGGGGDDGDLVNGVPLTDLAGAKSSETFYTVVVPPGASNLTFRTSGGTGDVDLYVRYGAPPTTSTWDLRPYRWGNDETAAAAEATAGTWHVMLRGWDPYTGVTLEVTWY